MRVQSFADRREDRVTWPDRQWEWAGKRPEHEIWDLPSRRDLEAREKWFFQAAIESPAMFRRDAGAGSLYWLGTRDNTGTYLDGAKKHKLTVPLPVPAKLFRSVTIYDPETRSEIQTDQQSSEASPLISHHLAFDQTPIQDHKQHSGEEIRDQYGSDLSDTAR
jgi:hypothetical protein